MKRAIAGTLGTVLGIIMLLSFKSTTPKSNSSGDVISLGASGPAAASPTSSPNTALTPAPKTATPTTRPTAAPTTTAKPTPVTPTNKSYLGSTVQTNYGPVQIRITYSAGRISGVAAVQLPSGRSRDDEINNYAVPILEHETIAAQSANIDSVSGASYTSAGYITSLQSAIDAAKH